METNEPIQRFRAGQVACALWENKVMVAGKPQVILKASVSRRYQDRNGDWKTSQRFSRNEIPLAIHVMQKAFEAMLEKPKEKEIAEAIEEKWSPEHEARVVAGGRWRGSSPLDPDQGLPPRLDFHHLDSVRWRGRRRLIISIWRLGTANPRRDGTLAGSVRSEG